MAGVIKNVIRTLFTSSGADTVQSDIARLTRGQTRLGQSSAGAGRQFAAQASGLGGLVAAYAGAAATSFALGAAFDALAKSARSIQTIEGVDTLAAGVAQSGSSLLKSVQEITKGQLTLTAAAEQTSLALSAGFNTSQIENLSEVALKASRALGRDLADSMTRVVRGSAKMETELLDELGIYTKIEPATRAYAAAIGKNVTALSEFERRQAFVNAVIVEGQRKFSAINTVIPTSAEQIEALGSRLADLATKLGAGIADLLAPLATGIVDNVAASFGALGLVLSLVAGKGVSLFTSSMAALVASMNASLLTNENRKRAWLGLTAVVLKATDANKLLTDSILRLNAADKASLSTIRTAAGTRALSGKEIKDSNNLLNTNLGLLRQERTELASTSAQKRADYRASLQAVRAAELAQKAASANVVTQRSVIVTGGIQTPEARAKAQAVRAALAAERASVTATANAKAAQLALKPAIDATRASITASTVAIAANTTAIQLNAAAITGWRARVAGATAAVVAPFIKSIGNLGTVFGSVLGAASKLFFVVSIFQLIGSSIANALGKGEEFNAFFSELGNIASEFISGSKIKEVRKNILGVTAGALTDIEKVNSAIRNTDNFAFKKTSFLGVEIKVEKTKEQLVKEVSSILADVGEEGGRSVGSSLKSGLAISLAGIGSLVGSFATPIGTAIGAATGYAIGAALDYARGSTEMDSILAEYSASVRTKFSSQLSEIPKDVQEAAVKALSVIQSIYGEKALIDPGARAAKALQEELIFGSVKSLRTLEALGQVIASTGLAANEINKNFTFKPAVDGIENLEGISVEASKSIDYLSEAVIGLGSTQVRFLFIDDLNEGLKEVLNTTIMTSDNIAALTVADIRGIDKLIPTDAETTAGLEKALESYKNKIAEKAQSGISFQDFSMEGLGDLTDFEQIIDDLVGNATYLETTLESAFTKLAGPLNSANRGFLLTSNLLRTTNDELSRGTLTLERFTQNTSNAQSAIIDANKALAEAELALPALQKAVASVNENDTAGRAAAEQLLDAQEAQIANLLEVAAANKSVLGYILEQEDSIKRQIELTSFLKEQGKGVMSDIDFEFALVKASSADATAASVKYFNSLKAGSEAEAASAETYQDTISSILEGNTALKSALKPEQIGAILTASIQTGADLKNTLKDVDKSLVEVVGNTVLLAGATIPLIEQTSQDALSVVELSADAMKKIAQDALLEATSLAKKLGDTVAQTILDVAEQLRTIEAEKTTAKIQFEIDSLNLDMEAAKAAREFNIAFLENKIKLTELSVDLKETKPVAGAEQINTYESDILAQRRLLLEDEKRISQEIYEKEIQATTDAVILEKARIDLEIQAKIDAINSEYKLLSDTISVYTSISSQLETAIVTGGNTMGETIISALNSGIKAFAGSFGKLGEALGFVPQEASFANAPMPGSRVVNLPSGGTITEGELATGRLLGSMATLEGAKDVATTALTAMGDAEKNAANERFRNDLTLQGRRRAADLLDFDRRAALMAQEEQISVGEAKKRLADAEAAGGAAEAVELLTGRLADLQSTIQGSLESAFMSINDLIIQGAQDGKDAGEVLRDIISGLFNTIQQEVFKQTIATPLADMISKWVVGGIKQLNLTDIRGSSLSGVLGSAVGATGKDALAKDVMSDKTLLAGAEAFKKAGATISNGITSLGAGVNAAAGVGANAVSSAAGVLATTTATSTGAVASANVAGASTLMSSLGPILAVLAVIAVIAGMFNKKSKVNAELAATPSTVSSTSSSIALSAAQAVPANLNISPTSINAMPKMAIGGLRDRVPTMLEPGEFVIRKPMVNRIGTSALEAMNATGKVPNAAPVINIKNEGSPKDASASPPRFDGEKYVIDIVMRDLANNGPIRKSLRGGAI